MPGTIEGNVAFIGDFDDSLEHDVIVPLIKEIQKQSETKNGYIDLHINSFGGFVHLCYHLVELVEQAKASGVMVRTIVPSVAFSAGSMLAVTGTPGRRYIGRRAEHLIHYGQSASFETTPTQIERFTAWKDRGFKTNLEHYRKYCNIPDLERQMLDDGFFVTARNAIKWGMADKYIDKMPLHIP